MGLFGDVFSFEKFNAGEMLSKAKKNPERLLLGAVDPFSTKVWGTVLGKDYDPMVDQWGSPTSDTYQKAEAEGIDTGAGRGMHNVAKTIASIYAGGAAGNAMGMGSSGAGQGATQGASQGASTSGGGLLSSGGENAAQTGLFGKAGGYMKQAQPFLEAAQTGMGVAGQMNQQQPIQQQPIYGNQDGNNALTSLAEQNQQYLTQLQQDAAARKQRRNMWRA